MYIYYQEENIFPILIILCVEHDINKAGPFVKVGCFMTFILYYTVLKGIIVFFCVQIYQFSAHEQLHFIMICKGSFVFHFLLTVHFASIFYYLKNLSNLAHQGTIEMSENSGIRLYKFHCTWRSIY